MFKLCLYSTVVVAFIALSSILYSMDNINDSIVLANMKQDGIYVPQSENAELDTLKESQVLALN